MANSARLYRMVLCGALVANSACDSNKPSPAVAPTPTPSTITAVIVAGISAGLGVGQSVQLTASVVRSDGTRSDATTSATWQSSDAAVATVSTAGLLTAIGFGDAEVTATVESVRGTAHVAVVRSTPPPIRYELTGVVHESAPTTTTPVSGATVGIHFVGCPSCPRDNETTSTDQAGRFTFTGIEIGGFALVVNKPGYDQTEYAIAQLPRDASPDIELNPTGRCSYLVKPAIIDFHSEDAVTGSFAVITPSYCRWTATAIPTGFFDGRTYYYNGLSTFSPGFGTGPATVTYTAHSTEGDGAIVEGIRISGLSGVNPPAQHTFIMAGR